MFRLNFSIFFRFLLRSGDVYQQRAKYTIEMGRKKKIRQEVTQKASVLATTVEKNKPSIRSSAFSIYAATKNNNDEKQHTAYKASAPKKPVTAETVCEISTVEKNSKKNVPEPSSFRKNKTENGKKAKRKHQRSSSGLWIIQAEDTVQPLCDRNQETAETASPSHKTDSGNHETKRRKTDISKTYDQVETEVSLSSFTPIKGTESEKSLLEETGAQQQPCEPCGEKSPERKKAKHNFESKNSLDKVTDFISHKAQEILPHTGEKSLKDLRRGSQIMRVYGVPGGDSAVMMMHPGEEICLWGRARLYCLQGEVSIAGYCLKADGRSLDLYSPDSNSLLTLFAHTTEHDTDPAHPPDWILKTVQSDIEKEHIQTVIDRASTDDVVVLFVKLLPYWCDLVTSVSTYQGLFSAVNNEKKSEGSGNDILGELGLQVMEDHIAQFQATDSMVEIRNMLCAEVMKGCNPVVAFCGGKNTGKSSLCRFMVNSMLNVSDKVAFLECDLGQTELTPSGSVSLHILEQPLIGPPFTHQRKAERQCFVGALSPGADPKHYMNCVKFVHQKMHHLQDSNIPLLINTMGWNKGLGLTLLAETLRLVQPNFVVQLNSWSRGRNMPPITPEMVANTPGWMTMPSDNGGLSSLHPHHLLTVESPVTGKTSPHDRYEPADHRHLSLLAHLGNALSHPVSSLQEKQPYVVPWSAVAVHVCHEDVPYSQVLYSMNASVVALCTVPEEQVEHLDQPGLPGYLHTTPVCECKGYGVVRGIDPEKKVFYIITSVGEEELQTINCLLRGSVDLPQALLLNQPSLSGEIPYVGESKDIIGAGAMKRRRHFQRSGSNRQPSNSPHRS